MHELSRNETLAGRLVLIEPLGSGGTAEVWKAREGDRIWAAKILPLDAPAGELALLEREHRVAALIDQPGIVCAEQILDADGFRILLRPYIEGRAIGTSHSPVEWLKALTDLAGILSSLHEAGIAHGDLKRNNVFLGPEGVLLSDCALAHAPGRISPPPAGVASPYAASPQRLQGSPPSEKDDTYAFGAILYELLTGRPPFWPDPSPERVAAGHLPAPVPTPPVPESLCTLASQFLSRDPEARPRLSEAARTLEDALVRVRRSLRGEDTDSVKTAPPPGPELISPVSPPRAPRASGAGRSVRWAPILVVSAVAVAVTFLVVLQNFAGWAPEPERAPMVSPAPERDTPPTPAPPSAPTATRTDSEAEMGRVESLQQSLRAMSVDEWGDSDWRVGLERTGAAERAHLAGAYDEAVALFREAAGHFEAERSRSRKVLEDALRLGGAAFRSGKVGTAESQYRLALKIDESNARARIGLARTASYETVQTLLSEARRLEEKGELAAAERKYEEAAKLDEYAKEARDGLFRVREAHREGAFGALMSRAVLAFQESRYEDARAALDRADELIPGTPEVAAWRDRLEESEQREKLLALQHRAGAQESAEDWSAALATYQSALEIDPELRFAQEGADRCRRRRKLAEELSFHLEHPERLSTPGVMAEARELLQRARDVQPAGPHHHAAVEDLEQAMIQASAEVPVVVFSDQITYVTVYRVGRLGRFRRKDLKLKPGEYTVVGTRDGYRDVREKITVRPDQPPEPVRIECTEKI